MTKACPGSCQSVAVPDLLTRSWKHTYLLHNLLNYCSCSIDASVYVISKRLPWIFDEKYRVVFPFYQWVSPKSHSLHSLQVPGCMGDVEHASRLLTEIRKEIRVMIVSTDPSRYWKCICTTPYTLWISNRNLQHFRSLWGSSVMWNGIIS